MTMSSHRERRLVSETSELGGMGADCSAIAAPLVAGVVAEELTWMNHLGLYHPARRNQYIYDRLQWKRRSGLPVIWNGMDGTKPDPRKPRQPEDEGRSTS